MIAIKATSAFLKGPASPNYSLIDRLTTLEEILLSFNNVSLHSY